MRRRCPVDVSQPWWLLIRSEHIRILRMAESCFLRICCVILRGVVSEIIKRGFVVWTFPFRPRINVFYLYIFFDSVANSVLNFMLNAGSRDRIDHYVGSRLYNAPGSRWFTTSDIPLFSRTIDVKCASELETEQMRTRSHTDGGRPLVMHFIAFS